MAFRDQHFTMNTVSRSVVDGQAHGDICPASDSEASTCLPSPRVKSISCPSGLAGEFMHCACVRDDPA